MLDGTDLSLLLEWQAYYELEPFGEERADIRNAITCMTIANAMGMKKRGGQFTLQDFMPNFGKESAKDPTVLDPIAAQSLMKKLYGNNSKSGRKSDGKNR